MNKNDFCITEEWIDAQKMLYVERMGAYGPENYSLMGNFKQMLAARGLFGDDAVILGIAMDDPRVTPPEKCRYRVCLLTDSEIAREEKVETEAAGTEVAGAEVKSAEIAGAETTVAEITRAETTAAESKRAETTAAAVQQNCIRRESKIESAQFSEGKYVVIRLPHTPEAVSYIWENGFSMLLKAGYSLDLTKPVIERYQKKLVDQHFCEMLYAIRG